jgi:hypothetical protein
MEQVRPEEMVPDANYSMETPTSVALSRLNKRNEKIYKTVIFKRAAYRLNGVWYYLFHVDGRKRYFTENDTFYKYVE